VLVCATILYFYALLFFASIVQAFGANHHLTLDHYRVIFSEGLPAIKDTMFIAIVGMPLGGLYGIVVGYLVEIQVRVDDGLRQVGLEGNGNRMITELSGGQQQRVALARAIVIQPGVLLFDEPLSNLDAQLRVQMRSEIRRLQKELKITAVYVTHDQEEAMAISDRIAIRNAGQIVQIGSAEDLYRHPTSRFVARFLGDANLVASSVIDAGVDRLTLSIDGKRWDICTRVRASVGSSVEAVVRPEAITLSDVKRGLSGRILSSTYLGAKIEYAVHVGSQTLQVVQSDPAHGVRFAEGAAVDVLLPSIGVHVLRSG
jgi:iron(III) transport system ATP-binding protein